MDSMIIDAANTVKRKKNKHTIDLIYNTAKKNYECDVCYEDFRFRFNELVDRGILVNKKPMEENGSYYVCNEKLRVPDNKSTMNEVNNDLNDTPEEKDLIGMIKNVMLDDKLKDKNYIADLEDEITFLKNESLQKNNTISTLLDIVKVKSLVNKTVIETTPTVCSFHAKNTSINSYSNSANRHLIIHDDDEFKSLEGDSLRKSDSNDSISHEWNVNDNWSESNSVVTNESNTKVINSKNSLNFTKLSLLDELGDNNNNQIELQSKLDHFRKESHQVYLRNRFTDENPLNVNDRMANSTKEHWNNINDKWRENAIMIAGDSITSGLVEDRLSKNKSIKVRTIPGTRINDFLQLLVTIVK